MSPPDNLAAGTVQRLKQDAKDTLLAGLGVQRIHIIGCARSGTTMLQYAMAAFADTLLPDAETRIWGYPSLRETLALVRRCLYPRRRRYLVTKRVYGWFRPEEVSRLLYSTLRHGFFVVHVVRDPRDVLTSRKGERELYVELERWRRSARASALVLERLRAAGYSRVLTVRYEDIVAQPERVGCLLMDRTGLRLRPGVASWARLRDNLAIVGQTVARAQAMHSIRDFDPRSVGRWRRHAEQREFVRRLLRESPVREDLHRFMATYDYPLEDPAAGTG